MKLIFLQENWTKFIKYQNKKLLIKNI